MASHDLYKLAMHNREYQINIFLHDYVTLMNEY